LILFKILKLFGLDVEAVKASLELRVEQAIDHVKQVAGKAAVIAALCAIATITAAMAVSVGLIALYRWTAAFDYPQKAPSTEPSNLANTRVMGAACRCLLRI
jgi:hypothetical protein